MAVIAQALLRAIAGPAWQQRGACRGEDPELFFPIGTQGLSEVQARSAKAVCDRCPVRLACNQWATSRGEVGIWGGHDEYERRALRLGAVPVRRLPEPYEFDPLAACGCDFCAPPAPRRHGRSLHQLAEKYLELAETGLKRAEIAARLGYTDSYLERALWKARRAGLIPGAKAGGSRVS